MLPVGAQAPDGEAFTGLVIVNMVESIVNRLVKIKENLCFIVDLLLIGSQAG